MTWFERYLQRQNDIAQGADADLLAENARRYRLATALLIASGLLFWIAAKSRLPHAAHTVLNVVASILAVASGILFRWARAVNRFLHSPDPEDPPGILKD